MSNASYGKLRNLTARHIIGALFRDGFSLARQQGSHQQYSHRDGRRVTVTFHALSQTFPPKTLKSMLETQAKWNLIDLKRLDLL